MNLNSYQWAAIGAALLTPSLLFLARKSLDKMNLENTGLLNLRAFLLMIQFSEGTIGKDAYKKLYGGGLFNDYARHPNIPITKYGITSTAAGAYQILNKTWQELQSKIKLKDFSPASQDRAAIELIIRRGALLDVMNGNFPKAIYKCRKEWASLPGAGYGQGEKSLSRLAQVYQKAGGKIVAA